MDEVRVNSTKAGGVSKPSFEPNEKGAPQLRRPSHFVQSGCLRGWLVEPPAFH